MDIQSKFPDLDPKDAIDSPTEVQRKEEKAAARRQYGIDYKRRQRKLKKLQKTMSESNAFLTPSKAPTLSFSEVMTSHKKQRQQRGDAERAAILKVVEEGTKVSVAAIKALETLSSQNAKADMEEWKLLVASAQHGP
jgi:hypothetical protein